MQAAVLHRQPQMVRHLIARGAPINGTGVIQSPLWFAVTHGDTAMAELLIALGADVNRQTNDMGSPLHAALYSSSAGGNRLALARLLLEHKADVNAIQNYPMFRNRCLATPLHAAVFSLDKAAVELLIKHGADLNATDRNGRTATQCARERLAVIKFNPLQLKEIIELLEAEQARVR
jgi:ankyrin repeat protein